MTSPEPTGGVFDVTSHYLMIDGQRIDFTAFKANENRLLINARGVAQFSVATLDEARDILRSLYSRLATND